VPDPGIPLPSKIFHLRQLRHAANLTAPNLQSECEHLPLGRTGL
jgi:hypothetical protein